MILGIETAVEHVGVALGDHRGIRARTSLASDRRHAEALTPMVQFVMQQAGVEMDQLSAIAVDIGPGLFTGMRVGLAAAQSMAWALDIPIAPVCSLDAVAMHHDSTDLTVAAALDARRGEVYWATYRMRGPGQEPHRLSDPVVSSPDDLAIHLAERAEEVVCVGSGFDRYSDVFEASPWVSTLSVRGHSPSAEALVTIGSQMLVTDRAVSASAVTPMYLRAPDAEINWQVREGIS